MKGMKKGLLVCLMTMLAVLSLVLAACGNTVTLRFDMDGGPEIAEQEVEIGTEVTLPTPSEREGFRFEGWYLTPERTGTPVTSETASEDRTFYAKWLQVYRVTLSAGSGTLAGENSFYLEAGASLSEALSSYTPTKDDCRFGGWLLNGVAITDAQKMPAQDIELTATYDVKYTVHVFKQSLTDPETYEPAEDITGYAPVTGTEFTPTVERPTGFKKVTKDGSLEKKTLSENASENVFTFYFDRDTVTAVLNSNYPAEAGLSPDVTTVSGLYGETVELSDEFSVEGYLLAGWATSQSATTAEYPSGVIENNLFGSDETVDLSYTLEGNITLYAVWLKGHVDMFGGSDVIFVVEDEVYLFRGGVFFAGEAGRSDDEYVFRAEDGTSILTCKILEDGEFCYSTPSREEISYHYLNTEEGYVDESIQLNFDRYNGITYTVTTTGSGSDVSKGTFTFDELGLLHTHFTSGSMKGHDFVFVTRTVTLTSGGTDIVFQVRDEEAYGYGVMYYTYFDPEDGGVQFEENYEQVMLDGFGSAYYNSYNNGLVVLGYYFDEDGLLELYDPESYTVYFILYLYQDRSGQWYYADYDQDLEIEIYEQNGNGVIALDGTFRAAYLPDRQSTQQDGYFSYTTSLLDGSMLLTLYSGQTTSMFKVWVQRDDTGESYVYKRISENYGEYLFSTEDGASMIPLLVVGEDPSNPKGFTLYGAAGTEGEAVWAVKGTLGEKADPNGVWLATVTEHNSELPEDIRFAKEFTADIKTLSAFTFSYDLMQSSDGDVYAVSVWWSATDKDSTKSDYSKVYAEKDGAATLTLVSGYAFLKDGEDSYSGSFADLREQGASYCVIVDLMQEYYVYVRLNDDGTTFILLNGSFLGGFGEVGKDGYTTGNYLELDGVVSEDPTDGATVGAKYVIVDDEGDPQSTHEGKVSQLKETTILGATIFKFTADEPQYSCQFVLFSTSQGNYFSPYNEDAAGIYHSEDGATLTLDGYGYRARYELDADTSLDGAYYLEDDGLVCFLVSSGSSTYEFYFDIKNGTGEDDKTFVARGTEYGNALVYDNRTLLAYVYYFDGLGNLTVSAMGDEELEEVATTTYTVDSETGIISFTYTIGSQTITQRGTMGILTADGEYYPAFLVMYSEVAEVYVNKSDYTVLTLDGRGNAVWYSPVGVEYSGIYVLLRDSLLYFYCSSLQMANIFKFDAETGIFEAVENDEMGYYTSDLAHALLFTAYGLVSYDGTGMGYYYVEDNGSVTIFYQTGHTEDANKYGIETKNFGEFDGTKTDLQDFGFGEETFYLNDGFAITFERKSGETGKYPLITTSGNADITRLTYTLTGGEEFSLVATFSYELNGASNQASGVVMRELEEGVAHLYLLIPTSQTSYFEYEIASDFQGENSTFSITSMSYVEVLESDYYWYMAELYLYFMGTIPDNYWGMIMLTEVYNEAGTAEESYLDAAFGSMAEYYDSEGNAITEISHAPYEELRSFQDGSILNCATFTGEDGEEYAFYFVILESAYAEELTQSTTAVYAYAVYAFTRVHEFTTENDYTVTLEMAIGSDYSNTTGEIFDCSISKSGVEADIKVLWETEDGKIYAVEETLDEQEIITETKYFILTVTLETAPEGAPEGYIPGYESVMVEVKDAETIYNANKTSYVQICDDKITLLYLASEGSVFLPTTCDKTGEGVYTVTITVAHTETDGSSWTATETYQITISEEDGVKTATILQSM